MNSSDLTDLSGKLLIAMPAMGDPRFERSVVFLCAHGEDGAMGLIVNKLAPNIKFGALLEQLDIKPDGPRPSQAVHFGGPVEHGRGFVLHSTDYATNSSTLKVQGDMGMTATLDVLEDIANNLGPKKSILALGYAGWGPGQLEDEIRENGWLICDGSSEIVFDTKNADKWEAALKSLGIDALTLSAAAGRA